MISTLPCETPCYRWHSHSVSDSALHQRVLCEERDHASHHGRIGRRIDSQPAAARGGPAFSKTRDRAGRVRPTMPRSCAKRATIEDTRGSFRPSAERVYEGPKGSRPKLRSRLKDWTNLSLKTIRLRASVGKYAGYRRLSRWRVGPKLKSRVYYAYQKKCDVRSVGRVQLIFSTMKPNFSSSQYGSFQSLAVSRW